jgi:hypothetical protein
VDGASESVQFNASWETKGSFITYSSIEYLLASEMQQIE